MFPDERLMRLEVGEGGVRARGAEVVRARRRGHHPAQEVAAPAARVVRREGQAAAAVAAAHGRACGGAASASGLRSVSTASLRRDAEEIYLIRYVRRRRIPREKRCTYNRQRDAVRFCPDIHPL